jgi:hypothetical protein
VIIVAHEDRRCDLRRRPGARQGGKQLCSRWK